MYGFIAEKFIQIRFSVRNGGFSPLNQHRILRYLTQLASQRYAPATLRAIPLTLTGFVRAWERNKSLC
jgi:hypothetical protein